MYSHKQIERNNKFKIVISIAVSYIIGLITLPAVYSILAHIKYKRRERKAFKALQKMHKK